MGKILETKTMEGNKKTHINIGSIGYGKSELNSAIETLLKTPEMKNQHPKQYTMCQERKPTTLSEQLMKDYEINKKMEEMRWLEEIGYFDDLERRAKQAIAQAKENNEEIFEK